MTRHGTAVDRTPRRGARLLAAVAGSVLVAACAPGGPAGTEPSAVAPVTEDYRPGMAATTYRTTGEPQAVVVLVPGGGWSSADPSGLRPLAEHLAASGSAVVTITYGTSGTGDRYPVPVDDVTCAVAYAAREVPGVPVVLVGHSAGAHLAVLAALRPQPRTGSDPEACAHPARAADAVAGLAGPYDVVAAGGFAVELFGSPRSDAPDLWTEGNPLSWASERPDVPVLLVHGTADDVVPMRFTDDLAQALAAGGHEVTTERLADVDHQEVYRPEAVGDLLADWVEQVTR